MLDSIGVPILSRYLGNSKQILEQIWLWTYNLYAGVTTNNDPVE